MDSAFGLGGGPFAIGQPVPRSEDPVLLKGEGRYTDDLRLPRQVHAAMVRSQHAHGVIEAIETEAARAMPGVLGVFTGADLAAAGYGTLACNVVFPNADGSPMRAPRATRSPWTACGIWASLSPSSWQRQQSRRRMRLRP